MIFLAPCSSLMIPPPPPFFLPWLDSSVMHSLSKDFLLGPSNPTPKIPVLQIYNLALVH